MKEKEEEEVNMKKKRRLMKEITERNPKMGVAWIGAARMEEEGGEIEAARELIMKGCEEVPR